MDELHKQVGELRKGFEALNELLEWLDENFFTGEIIGYCSGIPDIIVQGKFDYKEQMLQSFKERFNIE